MNLADEERPPLIVKATDFGRTYHLSTLVRSTIFQYYLFTSYVVFSEA